MWSLLFPWLTATTTRREPPEPEPSDCPACGEGIGHGRVPDAQGYRVAHCRRCVRGIEHRALERIVSDGRSR